MVTGHVEKWDNHTVPPALNPSKVVIVDGYPGYITG
jgi:hypothetical protein